MSLRRPRITEVAVTHPFIKGFTLPQEHDVSLDEIRIECLHETQNNIPGGEMINKHSRIRNIVGAENSDVQNYTSPHDRLGFFKINLPTIQPRSKSDEDG